MIRVDNITLYYLDRMIFLNELPEGYGVCAIIDPEYGIKESSKNHESRNTPVIQKNGNVLKIKSKNYKSENWDNQTPNKDFFELLKRKAHHRIIFGANYFEEIIGIAEKPPRSQYQDFINRHPRGCIIWDKMNGNNDCEIIYTSFDFDSFVLYYMWNGMMQGNYIGTDYNKAKVQIGNKKLNESRIHPTQKPVTIYKWLLINLVKRYYEIIDTGFGSASIAIACQDLGYTLTACDNNLNYYNNAKSRLITSNCMESLFAPEELLNQPTLF